MKFSRDAPEPRVMKAFDVPWVSRRSGPATIDDGMAESRWQTTPLTMPDHDPFPPRFLHGARARPVGIKRVLPINFQRLSREDIHEFFPCKLSLPHNREESSDGKDISFRDDYKEFLTRIVNPDQGRVATLSLVSCFP